MAAMLKLSHLLRASRLDRSTVRYVLQYADQLPDLPETGSQGIHRAFTIEQALRVAVCGHLKATGVRLQGAVDAVIYCEKKLRKAFPNTDLWVPSSSSTVPFVLSIYDAAYMQLSRGNDVITPSPNKFYRLKDGKVADSIPAPIAAYELNLTALRDSLEQDMEVL